MTLLAVESFGCYGTGTISQANQELAGEKWTSQNVDMSLVEIETGRCYIYHASQSSTHPTLIMPISGTPTTIVVGFRLNRLLAGSSDCLLFMDGATEMGRIALESDGTLAYYLSTTKLIGSTLSTALGSDDYWEIKIVFHNSAGSVEFYKNGVAAGSTTGQNTITQGSSLTQLYFKWDSWQLATHGFSDIYVDDSVVHQGDFKVTYEPADSAGTEADWTNNGDTTDHACVDELDPDDDTTYLETGVNGNTDSLGHGATTEIDAVEAIEIVARARKTGVGSSTLKLGCKHSGSEDLSSGKSLGTSYEYKNHVVEDVPGGSGWTETQSDAAEAMIEAVIS